MSQAFPFSLQFDPQDIRKYASRYAYADDTAFFTAGQRIADGDYTRANFDIIFRWKTGGRGKSRIDRNSDVEIADTLRLAVSAKTDRAAIAVLTGLFGVDVPVASAILTAINPDKHTILDFRALEGLGIDSKDRSVDFYLQYLSACRRLSQECGLSLRELDRALWQWSKERGKPEVPAVGSPQPVKATPSSSVKQPAEEPHMEALKTQSFRHAVYLVSCVSKKRASESTAKDLYISEWFSRVRAYVEKTHDPWFIISAKFGLVSPDTVIPPYDETLNTMSVVERRAWADRVKAQMATVLPPANQIVIFAGQRYREFLMDYLKGRAAEVEVPLEGLRIGEQLSWLGTHEPAR
jgi:hypothetical protein